MNTKRKIVVASIVAVMAMGMLFPMVSAYDASNAYTCTIQWEVPSDSTFSIAFAGAESSVDFDDNLTSGTQLGVQPDSQNNETSTPIITISNDGNVVLNFTCNLTAAKPAWATLKVNNETTYADATTFDEAAVTVNATVAIGQDTDMYIWTDVSSAAGGNIQRTLQINAATV